MTQGPVLDVSTAAILGVVAWLEGVRRVPEGAVLVQRLPLTGWRVLPARGSGRHWVPVGWAPFVTTVVVVPLDGAPRRETDSSRLDRALGPPASVLTVLGGLALISVVLGIPLGLGSLGPAGFVFALGASFALSVAVTLVAFVCARGLGMTRGAALRWAARFLSPFEAPRASEELLQAGLAGIPPGRVLRRLLSSQAFLDWLRPHAYDLHHDPEHAEPALLTGVDADELDRALATVDVIQDGATFYCARCGDSFLRGGRCPECDVALAPVGDGVS